MDYVTIAKSAWRASQPVLRQTPQFRRAVAAVVKGDTAAAASELSALDDPSLLLATMHLERVSVRLGHSAHPISERVLAQVSETAVDLGWISRCFQTGWASETAGFVTTKRISSVDGHGGWADLVIWTSIQTLVNAGDIPAATELLGQFSSFAGTRCSHAFALVGVASSNSSLMNTAVEKAVPNSYALGNVLEVFASGGVGPRNDAVLECVTKLIEFGQESMRRSARAFGVVTGACAAAKQGEDWLVHARELRDVVWPHEARHEVNLFLADQTADHEYLREHCGLDQELAALFPDDIEGLAIYLRSLRLPISRATLLHRNGRSVEHLIEPAIANASSMHHGLERIWGMVLMADPKRAEALLTEIREPQLAYKSASAAWEFKGEQERAASYYRLALREGYVPASGDELLLSANAELLDFTCEHAFSLRNRKERMEALSFLAQIRWQKGDIEGATDVIERAIEVPRSEEYPEWKPWSAGEDRAGWTPVRRIKRLSTDESKSADALADVAQSDPRRQLQQYHELAFSLDRSHLPKLRKLMANAPGGRGDEAQLKNSKLVEVALLDHDLDGALEIASKMEDRHLVGIGPAYTAEVIAQWLADRNEVVGLDDSARIISLFQAAAPQNIANPLLAVASLFVPKIADDNIDAFAERVSAVRSQLKSRDHASVESAVAVAISRRDPDEARSRMAAALDAAPTGIYVGKVFYIRALRAAGLLEDQELVRQALLLPSGGRIYEQCIALERSARILWDANAPSPLPQLLRDSAFPTEVCSQVRRSIVVMSNEYAPNPVESIMSVWLDEPPNEDQAREQILALADALGPGLGDEVRAVATD